MQSELYKGYRITSNTEEADNRLGLPHVHNKKLPKEILGVQFAETPIETNQNHQTSH